MTSKAEIEAVRTVFSHLGVNFEPDEIQEALEAAEKVRQEEFKERNPSLSERIVHQSIEEMEE